MNELKTQHRRRQAGFTIVEMLIVALLGTMIVAAGYQILRTSQRAFTIQSATVQGQQAIRAAVGMLASELRELSRTGEDIVQMSSDTLTVRGLRAFGLICDTTLAGSPIYVKGVGRKFSAGDSIFVFADNDDDISSDDTTLVATITLIDTTSTQCNANGVSEAVQRITAPALLTATAAGDTVQYGGPVRAYQLYTYFTSTVLGDQYLVRADHSAGTTDMLVGPLADSNPITFAYYDSLGVATTTVSEIYQIELTVRYQSQVVDDLGNPVADSIKTRVQLRN